MSFKTFKGSVLALTIYILTAIAFLIGILCMKSGVSVFFLSNLLNVFNNQSDVDNAFKFSIYQLKAENLELADFLTSPESVVNVKEIQWGFIEIVGASSGDVNKIAFTGYNINDKCSFYVPENYSAISVCGDCKIEGEVWIPAKGIKRGNVSGLKPHSIQNEIDCNINISKKEIDYFDKTKMFTQIEQQFSHNRVKQQKFCEVQNELLNSFYNDIVMIKEEDAILISRKKIAGNVVLISNTAINIKKDAMLTDIILKAPIIVIESGFTGSLQCIASDSLIIGEKCILEYPSVLALNHENSVKSVSKLLISDSCKIEGLVYVDANHLNLDNTLLSLGDGVEVTGQLMCNGVANLSGLIEGVTLCRKPIVISENGLFENYLINITIIPNDEKHFSNLLPGLINKKNKGIIKWLN